MVNNTSILWHKVIGTSSEFSLESQIFHSTSAASFILGAFYIPYNFFAGLYVASLSMLLLCLLFVYAYYNSRFKHIEHSSVLFGVFGLIIFAVNYFAYSGINESTDIMWRAYLLFLLIISPYRQHLLWLIAYIALFLILHLVAYQYPELVKHPYAAGREELTDRLTAFPLPVIVIYLVIKYIRKKYDMGRAVAEERAIALEAQNRQIMLQKEEIEKSNAEKNKLMSIISHDMRAPLINVQGYLEILNEHELDKDQRLKIEHDLLTATNSTMDMLTNLLQWSKSQMDGSAVNLMPVNLFDTLSSTLDMCKMYAQKKGIELNYDLNPKVVVVADSNMLQLVIRNLVSNAIKFTAKGGTISVEAHAFESQYKITVSDNGKGIAYNKQANLFSINTEPDYGTNNERGVGLGLTLCKEFIELQNGSIAFESTPGEGSRFFVFVPVA